MSVAAVGIGSNLGDRFANLVAAAVGLGAESLLAGVSSVYETAPVGGPEQGPFLNAVVIIETARPAAALLQSMLTIERARDRKRLVRWGPRSLDLDLLIFDAATIDLPGLTVPHPRLLERRFVVEPLRLQRQAIEVVSFGQVGCTRQSFIEHRLRAFGVTGQT